MKIACIGYRDWAIKIYYNLKKKLPNHNFYIITSKKKIRKKKLIKFNPDLILFYGWSWKIDMNIYQKFFSVMLHPSPLPKYSGGSPIQNQIIRGEKKSAVTLFQINKILDGGPILAKKNFSLNGNLSEIFDRIIKIGTELTVKIISKNYKKKIQNLKNRKIYKRRKPFESEVTINEIKNKKGLYLYNKIRMLQDPYPNPFIRTSDGKKLILKKVLLKD